MSKFFISHSSIHKPFCEEILTLLKANGHEGWLDAFDIHGGDAIPDTLVNGIYSSDYFLFVASPEASASKWVNWELAVATYREIDEQFNRPFIIPATRIASPKNQLIAHKNHLDFTGSAQDGFIKILGAVGAAPLNPKLSSDVHVIRMTAKTKASGKNHSTRIIEEAFWKCACDGRLNNYSFFPAAMRGYGAKVFRDKFLIVTDEKAHDLRQTVTEIKTTGEITVSESNYLCANTILIHATRLVQKIGRFAEVSHALAIELGWGNVINVEVQVLGVDRDFRILYDPTGLEGVGPLQLKSQFNLPGGTCLRASRDLPVDYLQQQKTIVDFTYEVQADLFHMLRIPGDQVFGNQEVSVRFKRDAVESYVADASQDRWSPA